jgi:ribosome-binding ATPase YchF (GTP1/OBG family)
MIQERMIRPQGKKYVVSDGDIIDVKVLATQLQVAG